ncbi:hypothetical protein A3K73_00360 [Candidatus Pacearchaeota archaeon RBG_13_36_9]|nr:MAG: hypothetical protein A3K73_00360 [Candidatus Pacearchaeota archaeon RBG_13_36_9]HJX50311.1 DUF5678 domain-containing protein [Candidatus Nanoarchaeia archaeon]
MLSDLELLDVSEKNFRWFQERSGQIREEFENQIIAIKDQKIVASAKTYKELLALLEQKGIDSSEVLIESISSKNEITIL